MGKHCVWSGFVCCYSGLDLMTCPPEVLCCKGAGTCICLDLDCCLMAGEPQKQVGMIKEDGMICKLGLPICTTGLMAPKPEKLLAGGGDLLCAQFRCQLPFGDEVPGVICAVYGAQCALDKDGKFIFGCCTSPYMAGAAKCEDTKVSPGGAPPSVEMQR